MDDLYNFSPSQIVMYTTPECGDCLRVKTFFNANHITYLQVGIETDEQAREFVAKINRGFYSVPTIIFPDGSVLVEPSWRELKEKIRT